MEPTKAIDLLKKGLPGSEPHLVPDLTFSRFWSVYKRKTGDKKKAGEKFDLLSAEDRADCIRGAIYHGDNNPQWQDQALIPHPLTFINQRRWENEITARPADEAIANGHKSPVDLAWSGLVQMFGARVIDQYGKTPPAVWRSQLEKLKPQQIARGLANCRDRGLEHPPALPQFISFCRTSIDHLPETRQLAKAPASSAVAESALEEMKKILNIR